MRKIIFILTIAVLFSSVGFSQNKGNETLRYLIPIFDKIDAENDLVYSPQNTNLTLDIYRPSKDKALSRPAIILVHGGGFSTGDKTQLETLAEALARRGYVVISINYTLADHPELNWAKAYANAIADTEKAVAWVRENSVRYGINSNFIALGGASAGGEIAHNYPDKSGLFAIISIYGSFSFPAFKLTDTPTILIHGDKDQFVPYETSANFSRLLTDKGIFNELLTLKGMGHGVMEGGGLGENDEFFYSAVTHITMFLYKCMFNCTNPAFKPENNEVHIYPGETLLLDLRRDKTDMSKGGMIHFNLEKNPKISGNIKFSADQETVVIPVKIPAFTVKTNVYLFYQSEFNSTNDIRPGIVLIRIIDPVNIEIVHPDMTLQLDNPTEYGITNGKVLIDGSDSSYSTNFSLPPGKSWTSPLPENITGRTKVRVMLQNGWIEEYRDYIPPR